ncbi:MAG: BON domain-containing protein [Acidobacteriota bacterium]
MSQERIGRRLLPYAGAMLAGVMLFAGCHSNASHPDDKDAVNTALKQNNLGNVSVSQDRDKGVMTLKGNVDSDQQKDLAASVTQNAAPGYTVANEIGVRPPQSDNAGAVQSDLDKGIEKNFDAMVKAHKVLNDHDVSGSAKNGTLVIKGTVASEREKTEAAKLAKSVPNVQQVVNEIQVNPHKGH